MLQLCQVAKRFPASNGGGPVNALDGIDLALDRGEFLAVKGPSGGGKTTLLLIAGGLLKPSRGRVLFADQDVYSLGSEVLARWRAENVGFVFQTFHLIPYLTVLENVLAPALAVNSSDAPRRAEELIERFGLTARRQHVPASLSTGEQQRVALARALLLRPKLLLCDEPTGNLDEDNGALVMDYIAEFQRDGGAVLLVTHDREAAGRAERRLRLRDGRIVPEAAMPVTV